MQTKALSGEELEMAKGASMARNMEIVQYLGRLWQEKKDEKEYIKVGTGE